MKLKEDDKYKMVLTTNHVLCNGSPVTRVVYDEDLDWQLFGDEEMEDDEEAFLVSIEEILEMEPALKRLPDMQPGQFAYRDKDATLWVVEQAE